MARICCHNAGSAGAAESQTSIFPLWTRSRKARGDSPATRRKLGAITVCDAAPARDKQVAYNRMERLRDPSHAAALCPEQLQALFEGQGLRVQGQQQYRLEVALADSLAASFPSPGTRRNDENSSKKTEVWTSWAWASLDAARRSGSRFPS